jgi:hypothetical protein
MAIAEEPRTRGKAARAAVPRRSHAEWEPAPDRMDPVALLESQAADRVPELVPIRHGRMLVSPFAFLTSGRSPTRSRAAASKRCQGSRLRRRERTLEIASATSSTITGPP